jgi:hypothetical protein
MPRRVPPFPSEDHHRIHQSIAILHPRDQILNLFLRSPWDKLERSPVLVIRRLVPSSGNPAADQRALSQLPPLPHPNETGPFAQPEQEVLLRESSIQPWFPHTFGQSGPSAWRRRIANRADVTGLHSGKTRTEQGTLHLQDSRVERKQTHGHDDCAVD